jgi:transketolase
LLIGTGSEVGLCLVAYENLKKEGVRTWVVSMPSCELFEQQDQAYRDRVLPPAVKGGFRLKPVPYWGGITMSAAAARRSACTSSAHRLPSRI